MCHGDHDDGDSWLCHGDHDDGVDKMFTIQIVMTMILRMRIEEKTMMINGDSYVMITEMMMMMTMTIVMQ